VLLEVYAIGGRARGVNLESVRGVLTSHVGILGIGMVGSDEVTSGGIADRVDRYAVNV